MVDTCQVVEVQVTALGEMLGRHQPWNRGLGGGRQERARPADEEQHRIDRRRARVRDRQPAERQDAEGQRDVADRHDPPAIETIGHVPARQRQHQHRRELHPADVPERDGPMGERIDLPADRDRRHLRAQIQRQRRDDVPAKIAVREGRAGRNGGDRNRCVHGVGAGSVDDDTTPPKKVRGW
jgi:hypothetical protein